MSRLFKHSKTIKSKRTRPYTQSRESLRKYIPYKAFSSKEQIDYFVQQMIVKDKTIHVNMEKETKLHLTRKLPKVYGDLSTSFEVKAGFHGKDRRFHDNDCLIHSLFYCLSPTFRRIMTDVDRNKVASYFRRKVLIHWIPKEVPGVHVDLLRSTDLLPDSIGDSICRHLTMNVLWIHRKNEDRKTESAIFRDHGGKYTIAISENGIHFQPVLLKYGPQTSFILENFNGEKYINDTFFGAKDQKLYCNFDVYEPVMYKDELHVVIDRKFPDKTVSSHNKMKCEKIKLQSFGDTEMIFWIDVNDLHVKKINE